MEINNLLQLIFHRQKPDLDILGIMVKIDNMQKWWNYSFLF